MKPDLSSESRSCVYEHEDVMSGCVSMSRRVWESGHYKGFDPTVDSALEPVEPVDPVDLVA